MIIAFNRPSITELEKNYVLNSLDGMGFTNKVPYMQACSDWFRTKLSRGEPLLTKSCTAALEIAASLINIKPGDEVIMPSFTFTGTATAFVRSGAIPVFVDIRPDTMNIDENLIEGAITPRTKAIVPVHYGGVACEMDRIMNIARGYNLFVIEDAAHALGGSYKQQPLGTIGDFGALSFHVTKNITSAGDGGLLSVNRPDYLERSFVIRDKGTNKRAFDEGAVNKYSWVDIGGNHCMNEVSAAFLMGQLVRFDEIQESRKRAWNKYLDLLRSSKISRNIIFPKPPPYSEHNHHVFFIKIPSYVRRDDVIQYMARYGIEVTSHYEPLHSSPAGLKFGYFSGKDVYTTSESAKLIRLPLWSDLRSDQVEYIVKTLTACPFLSADD